MTILAHHEMFLQYVGALVIAGCLCFYHLFPILKMKIVKLSKRLRLRSDKRTEEKWNKFLRNRFK